MRLSRSLSRRYHDRVKRFAVVLFVAGLLGGAAVFLLLRPSRDLVEDLASPDPQVVMEAARQIWVDVQEGVDVAPQLVRGLQHESPKVRARCLKTLARLDQAAHADEVVKRLRDPVEDVRIQAAVALRTMRGYSDPEALIAVVQERQELDRIRVDLVYSLATRRETRIIPLLATMAADPTEPVRVRMEAVRALGDLRSVEHAPLVSRLARDSESDPRLRRWSAQALGCIPAPEARRTLLALVSDESLRPSLRAEAALALSHHKDPEDAVLLQGFVGQDGAPMLLRIRSAQGLAVIGRPVEGAPDLIRQALADEHPETRAEAACLARKLREVSVFADLQNAAKVEKDAKAHCAIGDAICHLEKEAKVDPDAGLEPDPDRALLP